MLFLSSADFFQNELFERILSEIPSECQTVWTLIRPDDLSGLIWVLTVYQGYQQTTLVDKVNAIRAGTLCTFQYYPPEWGRQREYKGNYTAKDPNPQELDRASRHRGGKIRLLFGNSNQIIKKKIDSPSKGFWTPHIYPCIGN